MEAVHSFRVFDKLDYDKKYKLNDSRYLSCYSKRQLKKSYDPEEYSFIGEMASNSTRLPNLGHLKYSSCIRPVFAVDTFSRWRYREKGYVVCESRPYEHRAELIILLQDVMWLRLLQGSGLALVIWFIIWLLS